MSSNKASKNQSNLPADRRIGFWALAFLVISGMIGGGVFMMPSQMANPEADGSPIVGPGSELIAWLITAVGIWFMVCTFRMLSTMRPDLKAGIFSYAHTGFGKLVGFLVAWGYWIFNTVSCAAYGMLVMGTLHYFFPRLFVSPNGNTLIAIACASAVNWIMVYLANRGAKESAALNIVGTVGKTIPIITFIVVCALLFNPQVFTSDFWGLQANGAASAVATAAPLEASNVASNALSLQGAPSLATIASQVGPCAMVTLWVFLGIEGAVVASGEAKSQKDVSRATLFGFLVTLCVYLLVSLLPFGLYSPGHLGSFQSPSMGTILADAFGPGALVFINLGIIVSVLSSWLVWVVLCTQMPYFAAREDLLPASLANENSHGAPTKALIYTGVVTQIALVLSLFVSGNVWDMITNTISAMAAPCYLFCALFLLKIALLDCEWRNTETAHMHRKRALIVGLCAIAFSIFLILAGNTHYILIACFLYAIGIPFLLYTRYKRAGSLAVLRDDFYPAEWAAMGIVVLLGIIGICSICCGLSAGLCL